MKRILLFLAFSISCLYAQQTQFFRTYSMGLFDVGETVLTLNDTSYVVAGTTNTTGMNGTDLLLFKTNSVGDVTWWKNYGGAGIQSGKGAVIAADGSGYLVTGYKNNFDSTGYDVWLVKTNLVGDSIWEKSYGGGDWEIAHSIQNLKDSTYIIAGETYSFGHGQRDMYILRINGAGDTLWTRTFGGAADDVAEYIHMDRNNNILIVGNTESFGAGGSDVYLVYMDINGDTLWTKTMGSTDDDFGYSADMYIDTANQMSFVIGYTQYYAAVQAQNAYISIIDSLGGNVAVYPQSQGGAIHLDAPHVVAAKPGWINFTADYNEGTGQPYILFAQKTSYQLTPVVSYTYASGVSESTRQNNTKLCLDKGLIVTGNSENWGPGPTSCILLKMDTAIAAPNAPVVSVENLQNNLVELFPNPVVSDYFYVNSTNPIQQVQIMGLNGQLIYTYPIKTNTKTLTLNKLVISTGIYLLAIKTSVGVIYKKIVF